MLLLFQKGTKLSFFVIMILVFGLTHCQFLPAKPTEPVPCTNENRGHCECGNISQGFHTYTFWIGEMQRCFTVYHPVSREKEKLPVFFGQIVMQWINWKNQDLMMKIPQQTRQLLGLESESKKSDNKVLLKYELD